MSHTKGKWSIMAGAPWNILCEGGARIVWCRSNDERNGEPADIANARHIVDLHNAAEDARAAGFARAIELCAKVADECEYPDAIVAAICAVKDDGNQ